MWSLDSHDEVESDGDVDADEGSSQVLDTRMDKIEDNERITNENIYDFDEIL